jgi:hypothetical protein
MWHGIGWDHIRHDWQYRTWGIGLDGGITLAVLAGWAITAMRAFRRDSIETVTLAVFPVEERVFFTSLRRIADRCIVLRLRLELKNRADKLPAPVVIGCEIGGAKSALALALADLRYCKSTL